MDRQQLQQGQQAWTADNLLSVISQPKLFNDVRDQIIGNFNKVQSFWGTGQAYYSLSAPPLDLDDNVPTHKFKAIGFARISQRQNNDAQGDDYKFGVLLKVNVDETQFKASFPTLESNLRMMFGISFAAKIESSKILPENRAILTISVTDCNTNKRISAVEILKHLVEPQPFQQLNQVFSNNLLQLVPLHSITKQEIEEYLNQVPAGIDAKVWAEAKQANPDPERFIPIPLVGFHGLNERFKMQQHETQQQRTKMLQLTEEVSELQKRVASMESKIDECRRRKILLSNRVLKVLIWQEVANKRGFPIQADEEKLRSKLENILSELHAPTKFKGCLSELFSRLKQMQNQQQRSANVNVDEKLLEDIKNQLKQEQQGISYLIQIIKRGQA